MAYVSKTALETLSNQLSELTFAEMMQFSDDISVRLSEITVVNNDGTLTILASDLGEIFIDWAQKNKAKESV